MSLKKRFVVFVFLAVYVSGVYALTEQNTTMTWNIPASKGHTITYGGSCSTSAFYFDEAWETLDSNIDGNAMRLLPYSNTVASGVGVACQSSTAAAMTITNTGNVATNIDGNFTGDTFTAADVNIQLKVWMGLGSPNGCGTNGAGGWQLACGVTGSNPVTQTTCRLYNNANQQTTGRLVTNLAVGDSNQLCFASDFNSAVGPAMAQGTSGRAYNFRTSNT